MPQGVYPHKPHQGFQKGHGGFDIDYSKRRKPRFSSEYLAHLREGGKILGKYFRTEQHRKAQSEVAGMMLAKLNGSVSTWIERRFEQFLTDFGLVRGIHFVVKPTVYTQRTHRFPDFLLANNVIIEVDGAPWHVPWKDYFRDLDLEESGFRVFHFTSKEINANPVGCCDRLIKIVNEVPDAA